MTQDVVRRRYKEEEIRQAERLQIIVALHFSVVAATGPGDDLVLRAVDLCASQDFTKPRAVSTRLLAAAKLVSSTAGMAGGVTPTRRPPNLTIGVPRLTAWLRSPSEGFRLSIIYSGSLIRDRRRRLYPDDSLIEFFEQNLEHLCFAFR